MPFRRSFDCLWCGRPYSTRDQDALEGWAQLCPDCVGRADENPFIRFRLHAALHERATGAPPTEVRRETNAATEGPPTEGSEMVAYYEARAAEYDDWYLRRGRYERGPVHDVAWAAELDEAGRWLDALPIGGQIVELAWPAAALPSIVWGPRCYVVPRLDHTVLVGASAERVGYDERTTAAGIKDLLDAACELLPDARHASFLGARAGLRPATPDELPALGDDPSEAGVVYALGHYRNGVLLAPITAKLIGDLVADGRRDPALDSFRVDRFRSQIV